MSIVLKEIWKVENVAVNVYVTLFRKGNAKVFYLLSYVIVLIALEAFHSVLDPYKKPNAICIDVASK